MRVALLVSCAAHAAACEAVAAVIAGAVGGCALPRKLLSSRWGPALCPEAVHHTHTPAQVNPTSSIIDHMHAQSSTAP